MNKVIIIAHRAQDAKEPIPERFGIEIDVRDCVGLARVSHDPIIDVLPDFTLKEWIARDRQYGQRPLYALNIKADNLEEEIRSVLEANQDIIQHFFIFDGSYPAMRRLQQYGIPVAERISEEEPWRGHSHIIWLDRWDWDWCDQPKDYNDKTASGPKNENRVYIPLSHHGKKVQVYAVSPELHLDGPPMSFIEHHWRRLFRMGVNGICTDYWLKCETYIQQLEDEKRERGYV